LHQRLRQARERRGLSLETIAQQWGVREQNLLLIERDAFEDLPTGLYGRNAVRAYATAVGIPGDEALAEIQARLRVPEDPLDGLARVRGLARQPLRPVLDVVTTLSRASASRDPLRALAAAAIDGAVLGAIELAIVGLTALAAGVRTTEAVQVGAPALLLLGGLIGTLYFVLLGGIRRATIGARVVRLRDASMLDGSDVRSVIQRSVRCVFAEAASLFRWIMEGLKAQDVRLKLQSIYRSL
jgi:transcriptional regulator with XRE-family HTH domain